MASYEYQYGTSARELEPEVRSPRKSPKKTTKATNKKNAKVTNNSKKKTIKSKKYQDKVKANEVSVARTNFSILMVIILGCILLLMYRNVKIRESFARVQSLSKSVSSLEKENSQIAVNIQNHLNLSDIEKSATYALGMQKLSSKQTFYITLDTKDYTELAQKSITKENKTNILTKVWNCIVDCF